MAYFITVPFNTVSEFEAFAAKRDGFPESIRAQIENRARDYAARRRRPVGRCPLTLGLVDSEELDAFGTAMRKSLTPRDAAPACAFG